MSRIRGFAARVRALLGRGASETRMEAEFRFHVDMETDRLMAQGLSAAEARRRALVTFGGMDQHREAMRDGRGARWLEDFVADLRYALRSLRRAPTFTAAAVATLALSVGATTSIFSVVNAVLLRGLPYPNADRIVALCEKNMVRQSPALCPVGGFSASNFLVWRDVASSFDAMAAFYERRVAIAGADVDPVSAEARITNASVFHIRGVRPAAGRLLTEADDRPGAPNVVVLSHGFWQQSFGGDQSIIGRTVQLNAFDYTVVGVTAPGFGLYEPVDVWMPIRFTAEQRTAPGRYLRVIGRLKPGVTVDQADREMNLLAARRAQDEPRYNTGMTALAMPLRDKLVGSSERVLWTLLAAVGFLLLIACANVANLLLARASDREREMAVRISLGASPRRLVRQLLTESVVLSVVAAVIGLALAIKGTQVLVALVPTGMSIQPLTDVSVDWRLLTFTAAVALGTGLLFGVAPAFHAARSDVQETLKEGGRGGSSVSRSSARLRSALVVAEMSLALVLLAGAGLMVRSFAALQHVRLGFQPEHALTARMSLPARRYTNDTAVVAAFHAAEEKIAALPGVQAVGAISYLPLTGQRSVNGFNVDGRPPAKPGDEPAGDMRAVTPGYFRAMGIPISQGRPLTDADGMNRPPVAVVSETLARTLFPGESAIGHYLLYDWDGAQRVQIVGVAGDVHHDGPDKEAYMEIYRPHAQFAYSSMALVVRVSGDPSRYAALVRAAVREVDRNLPLASTQPVSDLVAQSVGATRLSATLFGLFGGLGLLLAAIGIYGVMSYTVQQRRHEFGIRLALGASRRHVVALVMLRGAALSFAGIALGTAAALSAAGLMQKLLFGVPPHDRTTFVAIALILGAVGTVAAYLPGRRATRVDPVTALRGE